MTEYQIGPWRYASLSCLTSGDYAPAGAIAIANQRAIDAMIESGELTSAGSYRGSDVLRSWGPPEAPEDLDGADVLILTWAYSGQEYLIRCDDDASETARGILSGLDGYPLLNEELHSEVEEERRAESWDHYVCSDVTASLARETDYGPECETWEALSAEDQRDAFERALSAANVYWEDTSEGASVDYRRALPHLIWILQESHVHHGYRSGPDGSGSAEVLQDGAGGWWWRACFPGCLPDGEWSGPHKSEADAMNDAFPDDE